MRYGYGGLGKIYASWNEAASEVVKKVQASDYGYWDVSGLKTSDNVDIDGIFVLSGNKNVAKVILSRYGKDYELRAAHSSTFSHNFMDMFVYHMGVLGDWACCVTEYTLNGHLYLLVNDITVPDEWHFQYYIDNKSYTSYAEAEEAERKSILSKLFTDAIGGTISHMGVTKHIMVLSGQARVLQAAAYTLFGIPEEILPCADVEISTRWQMVRSDGSVLTQFFDKYTHDFKRGIYRLGDGFYLVDDVTPVEGWNIR